MLSLTPAAGCGAWRVMSRCIVQCVLSCCGGNCSLHGPTFPGLGFCDPYADSLRDLCREGPSWRDTGRLCETRTDHHGDLGHHRVGVPLSCAYRVGWKSCAFCGTWSVAS